MSAPDQPHDTRYPAADPAPAPAPAPAPPPADPPAFGTDDLNRADREARKRKREAEVSDEAQQVIGPHVAEFQAARAAYEPALAAAQKAMVDPAARLQKITDELTCRVAKADRDALDVAWEPIPGKLPKDLASRELPPLPDPYQDGTDTPDTPDTLAPRIALGRQGAATVDGTFKELVAEQTAVVPRVTTIAADIEALATAVAADTADENGDELYARALVLQWRLKHALAGFESVDTYGTKVTKTLQGLVDFWARIRDLEGAWADLTRKAELEQQDVDAVRADPVKAVLNAKRTPAPKAPAAAAA